MITSLHSKMITSRPSKMITFTLWKMITSRPSKMKTFTPCTELYRTQLPLIENSFNGCQGHPPLCLPPGTTQWLPDRIQKVFGRAAIYSANSSRWHKCKSGWSLKTERSIVNDMYTLILLIQYGIYFWHELAYTLPHFLKLNSNICGNPLAFSLTFDLQYYLNCT